VFSKTGDVWTLGKHRLVCGDSTKEETYKVLMGEKLANVVITDPPYNVNVEKTAGKIKNDNMKNDEFYTFLLSAFTNMYKSMVDGAAIYIFHSDSEKVNFYNACVNAGFHYSSTCIWVKDSLVIGRADYQQKHEPVLYAFKDTKPHVFYGDRKQTTTWSFPRPKKSDLHPTMKPIPLLCYPMKNSSMANCIVLDPFLGSGSTLIAAEQMDRICYGIELDEKFCDVIVKRYIEQVGTDENVSVERDGKIYKFSEICSS
jgi:DNA modification methylase